MRKLAFSAALLAAGVFQASAVVLTFDDIGAGSGTVPANYGGFSSWGTWQYYDSVQPPYNPNSGATRTYVGSEAGSHIMTGTDIIFNGAYFAGHGEHDGFGNVFFRLYNNGNLVHTSGQIDSNATPTFLASGYAGAVDEVSVDITTGPFGFFVMDDFTYEAVPEPATMVALTLGGLCLLRRRRAS